MKTLTVDDVRKEGDEVRQMWETTGTYRTLKLNEKPNFGPWEPVSLVGWPILPADLFNAEFRRP